MYRKSLQLNSGYNQNLRACAYHGQKLLQPVCILQPPYHNQYSTPNKMMTITYFHMMTVEQTSNWVRSFCTQRGWQEATVYATSFSENGIDGGMLKHLNHEILKFEMGIFNAIHRLELLAIFRQLLPSYTREVLSEPTTLSALRKRNTKWDCQQNEASAFPTPGHSKPVEGLPRKAQYLVPERYVSPGMDLSSALIKSTNSISTNSASEMEVSENKFPHPTIRKSLSVRITLQQKEHTAKYPQMTVSNFGGAE